MRKMNAILSFDNKVLSGLMQKTDTIRQMQDVLYRVIPREYASRYIVANYKQDELRIIVKDSMVGTRFRYMQEDILQALHRDPAWRFIKKVKLKLARSDILD